MTTDSRTSSSVPLTVGAAVLAALVAVIGLKPSGGGVSADKPAEVKGEPAEWAILPRDGEPHRVFIRNHLLTTRSASLAEQETEPIKPGVAKPLVAEELTKGKPSLIGEGVGHDRLDILIAMVPDPIDTPFGFWYDQIVEGLTRAVCDAGDYNPGKHWSPWQQYLIETAKHGSAKESLTSDAPLFERFPGVLMFHGKNSRSQSLALLLVSETPRGIRVGAMSRAMEIAAEVASTHPSPKIRLVAPFFTGSMSSLERFIRDWHHVLPPDKGAKSRPVAGIDIISGAANGIEVNDFPDLFKNKQGANVRFRSTIIPSRILRNAAVHFLKEARIDRDWNIAKELTPKADFERVALLVESNTGFGRAQVAADPCGRFCVPDFEVDLDDLADLADDVAIGGGGRAARWPIYLPYPMHLSRVQARYAQERLEKEKRYGLPEVLLPGARKPWPRSNSDLIPTLDKATTPSITDRGVDDIASLIRRSRVRFAGILSTDPQDKVFLVERIKRQCPNVTIFVTGGDLFYALPENRHIMRNVVISTTYPLIPYNQLWTEPKEWRRQTFHSEDGQGYYNAAAYHMADLKHLHLNDVLQEYSPPVFAWGKGERPAAVTAPAWILTMGENGQLVPLGFYDRFKDDAGKGRSQFMITAAPPTEETTIEWPGLGSFRITAALVFVVTAALLVWLARGRACFDERYPSLVELRNRGVSRWWLLPSWLYRWWRADMWKEEQQSGVYKALALTAAVFSLFPVLSFLVILCGPWFANTPSTLVCLVVLIGVALFLILASLVLQVRLIGRQLRTLLRPGNRNGAGWIRLAVAALLLACEGLVLSIFIGWHVDADPVIKVLSVERAAGVLAGYSVLPAVLFLAAGFLVYSYYAIQRSYLSWRFYISPPYPNGGRLRVHEPFIAQQCQVIRDLALRVKNQLANFSAFAKSRWQALLAGVVLYVAGAAALLSRSQRTLEGGWWDVPFAAGFFVLGALVLLTLWRFLVCWRGIENILKKMALIPMVRAFDRLPRKTASLFGGYIFTRKPRSSHLAIPVHIMTDLQELLRSVDVDNPPQPDGVHPPAVAYKLREPWEAFVQRTRSSRTRQDPAAYLVEEEYPGRDINLLSNLAKALVVALAAYWPQHSVADAFGEQVPAPGEGNSPRQGSGPDKDPLMPEGVRKAEDFVAILAIMFLSQYFILLRTLVWSMVAGSVLLLLAATSYPFQPEELIMYLLLGLNLAVGMGILHVLVAMNKNELISRITQSTPNRFELNWSFVVSVLQYTGPIVLILAAHFSGRLRVLVEPLMNILH